ncbi:hypothetical protein EVAR_33420_1 [Eumeta japonica]|uniref:Uncharacterized protein n=1 Tax=Eumeta variegata TaxID=151549 RepID=A0A4C1W363_EUMVA|nr:hypothetical protein EVAR_33420_1 [Eumeta japonica]
MIVRRLLLVVTTLGEDFELPAVPLVWSTAAVIATAVRAQGAKNSRLRMYYIGACSIAIKNGHRLRFVHSVDQIRNGRLPAPTARAGPESYAISLSGYLTIVTSLYSRMIYIAYI